MKRKFLLPVLSMTSYKGMHWETKANSFFSSRFKRTTLEENESGDVNLGPPWAARAKLISNTYGKIHSWKKSIFLKWIKTRLGERKFLKSFILLLRAVLTCTINPAWQTWWLVRMAAQKANVRYQKFLFAWYCIHSYSKTYFLQEGIHQHYKLGLTTQFFLTTFFKSWTDWQNEKNTIQARSGSSRAWSNFQSCSHSIQAETALPHIYLSWTYFSVVKVK